jgi:hypothetical protein
MNITTVGIDLAKNIFSVHGVDAHGMNDRRDAEASGASTLAKRLSSSARA